MKAPAILALSAGLLSCLAARCEADGAALQGQPERQSDSVAIAPTDPKPSGALSKVIFPIAFYTPETGTAGALSGGFYRRFPDRERPSSLEAQLLYTQRHQYGVSANASHYLKDMTWLISLGLFAGEFPDLFYGVGATTPSTAKETFTARTLLGEAEAGRLIGPGLRAGGAIGWAAQSMEETEPGGLLDRSAVEGSGSWTAFRLGPKLALDTRNSAFFPTTGVFATATLTQCARAVAGDFDFGQLELNARGYIPAGKKGTLALQAVAEGVWGDVPFPFLSKLGGSELLRGYYQGRYRDRDLACLQSEYRFHIWRRLGGAAFASAGKLADEPGRLFSSHLRYAYGAGLRMRLNEEGVNLRGDFARNREGETAIYVTFMEAY
jgi:hypothetical protein